MARPARNRRAGEAPLLRRLAWFAAIWAVSVGALTLVAAVIRWWLGVD